MSTTNITSSMNTATTMEIMNIMSIGITLAKTPD
jgi:hypothetical protein